MTPKEKPHRGHWAGFFRNTHLTWMPTVRIFVLDGARYQLYPKSHQKSQVPRPARAAVRSESSWKAAAHVNYPTTDCPVLERRPLNRLFTYDVQDIGGWPTIRVPDIGNPRLGLG